MRIKVTQYHRLFIPNHLLTEGKKRKERKEKDVEPCGSALLVLSSKC